MASNWDLRSNVTCYPILTSGIASNDLTYRALSTLSNGHGLQRGCSSCLWSRSLCWLPPAGVIQKVHHSLPCSLHTHYKACRPQPASQSPPRCKQPMGLRMRCVLPEWLLVHCPAHLVRCAQPSLAHSRRLPSPTGSRASSKLSQWAHSSAFLIFISKFLPWGVRIKTPRGVLHHGWSHKYHLAQLLSLASYTYSEPIMLRLILRV